MADPWSGGIAMFESVINTLLSPLNWMAHSTEMTVLFLICVGLCIGVLYKIIQEARQGRWEKI